MEIRISKLDDGSIELSSDGKKKVSIIIPPDKVTSLIQTLTLAQACAVFEFVYQTSD